MSHSIKEFEETILPSLGRTMKCIDYFVSDSLQAAGISLSKVQMILLVKLIQNDGQPQFNLAYLTNRDKASLTRLIGTMEKKELVKRVSSSSDKRIKKVYITDLGKQELMKAQPVMKQLMEHIQRGISQEEITTVISVMSRINNNIHGEDSCLHITDEK